MSQFSSLDKFLKKLNRYQVNLGTNNFVKLIVDEGVRKAEMLYASSKLDASNIIVVGETSGSKGKIVAYDGSSKRPQIGYLEFGTGLLGEGKYKGKLPTRNIYFHSYGLDLYTHGWVYNYAYRMIPQLRDTPWQGNKPEAQMYKTSEYLKKKWKKIVTGKGRM